MFQNKYFPWDIIKWCTLLSKAVGRKKTYWNVRCHCGKEYISRTDTLHNNLWCWCKMNCNRKPFWESLYNAAISKMKSHIRKRWLDFSLTDKEMLSLIKLPCEYCWDIWWNKISYKDTYAKSINYNWIDRVDSSIWYVYSNCVPCCRRCNQSKNDMNTEDFKKHIRLMYNHLQLW